MKSRNVKRANSMRSKFAIAVATISLSLIATCAWAEESRPRVTTPPTSKTTADKANENENKDFRGNLLPEDYDIKKVARTKISINVKDASIFDIIDAVSDATTEPNAMEVRYSGLERISLKVKDMPIEDVLRGAATLNHLNLYILPDRFVIGRSFMLSEEERKNLIQPDFDSLTPPVITKEQRRRNLERLMESQE